MHEHDDDHRGADGGGFHTRLKLIETVVKVIRNKCYDHQHDDHYDCNNAQKQD
jgi:hypothetical protein